MPIARVTAADRASTGDTGGDLFVAKVNELVDGINDVDGGFINLAAAPYHVTSGTNITSALQTARDAAGGKRIYLPAGTYQIDNYVASPVAMWLEGDGPGATILERAANATALQMGGQVIAASSTDLSSDAAAGDVELVVVSTTGIAAGDYLAIASDEAWVGTTAAATTGEIVRVESVDSGTELTLHSPLAYAYATADNAAVQRLSMQPAVLRGLSFQHTTQGTTTALMLDIRCSIPLIEDVEVLNSDGPAMQLQACIEGKIIRPRFVDLSNNAAASRYGYGVSLGAGCRDMRIIDPEMVGGRHCVTTAASSASLVGGVARACVITGGTARECTNIPWDTHEEGDQITFVDCQVIDSLDSGFHMRAPNSRLVNPIVDNVKGAGIVLTATATRSMVDGGRVSRCRAGPATNAYASQGVRLDGVEQEIINTRIHDTQEDGIRVAAVTGVRVAHVRVESAGLSGSNENGVRFVGGSGHYLEDVMILDTETPVSTTGGAATGFYRAVRQIRGGAAGTTTGVVAPGGWTAL